jgi:N-alpha-acetyltransferase 40
VFGWDPVSKQRELFDPLSRFILVHQQSQNLGDGNASKRLVAYTMFRFDMEEGEEVVYWCVDAGTCS